MDARKLAAAFKVVGSANSLETAPEASAASSYSIIFESNQFSL
jgi:hypothetical protein